MTSFRRLRCLSKISPARHERLDQLGERKAKEVVGAITGNDSLTAEGQLEQTQARDRMDANSVDAIADAEAEQARAQALKAREEGAQERAAVNDEQGPRSTTCATTRPGRSARAEQDAEADAERAKMRAELDAQREVQQGEGRGARRDQRRDRRGRGCGRRTSELGSGGRQCQAEADRVSDARPTR